MQRDAARMWPGAVFPQINSLPSSQRELSGVNGNGKIHRRERGANVRGHVVVALGGVDEQRIAVAHEPRKKGVKVTAHVGIGVFLNQQGRGSVAQMQREQSIAEIIFDDPFLDVAGELAQPASARGNRQFVKSLAKHRDGLFDREGESQLLTFA